MLYTHIVENDEQRRTRLAKDLGLNSRALQRSCLSKIGYLTDEALRKAVEYQLDTNTVLASKKYMIGYECLFCGMWHQSKKRIYNDKVKNIIVVWRKHAHEINLILIEEKQIDTLLQGVQLRNYCVETIAKLNGYIKDIPPKSPRLPFIRAALIRLKKRRDALRPLKNIPVRIPSFFFDEMESLLSKTAFKKIINAVLQEDMGGLIASEHATIFLDAFYKRATKTLGYSLLEQVIKTVAQRISDEERYGLCKSVALRLMNEQIRLDEILYSNRWSYQVQFGRIVALEGMRRTEKLSSYDSDECVKIMKHLLIMIKEILGKFRKNIVDEKNIADHAIAYIQAREHYRIAQLIVMDQRGFPEFNDRVSVSLRDTVRDIYTCFLNAQDDLTQIRMSALTNLVELVQKGNVTEADSFVYQVISMRIKNWLIEDFHDGVRTMEENKIFDDLVVEARQQISLIQSCACKYMPL